MENRIGETQRGAQNQFQDFAASVRFIFGKKGAIKGTKLKENFGPRPNRSTFRYFSVGKNTFWGTIEKIPYLGNIDIQIIFTDLIFTNFLNKFLDYDILPFPPLIDLFYLLDNPSNL